MNETDLQQSTPDVNTNMDERQGDGVGGVSTSSEADLVATAAAQTAATSLAAIVTMTAATSADITASTDTIYNSGDVPYDLLLDDELNGFFDDEDAISTTTDEGGMSYYLDRKHTTSIDDGDVTAAAASGTTMDTAPTDTSAAAGSNEVGKQNDIHRLAVPIAPTGIQHQEGTNNNQLPTSPHPHNNSVDMYTSDVPIPLGHAHSLLSAMTSTTTVSSKNNAPKIVAKVGNSSVMDELNMDDIVIDGVEPTLAWHNEQFDRHHRQAMIRLIVTLLKARKKENPTRVWMVQLPIKARKLERRLYHSAASLAAYNDRTTLKQRLLDLVRDIAEQHHESRNFDNTVAQIKKQQQPSSLFRNSFRSSRGGSVTSQSSIESSSVISQQQQTILNRSSFVSTASIDSLRDLRESVDTRATIESITSKIIPSSISRSNSVSSKRSATRGDEHDNAIQDGTSIIDKKLKESTDAFDMPAPRQRVRSTKASSRNSTASRSNPGSRSNSFTVGSISNAPLQPPPTTAEEHRQQQKSINQRLQEQILENIRLQEEIVRKLQQTDQQMLLTNNSSQSHSNNTQQQQQYDPLSMYMLTNDFASNMNNNVNMGGHGMLSPNGIISSSSPATTNLGNGLNIGISNQPSFPQQQQSQQYSNYNTSLNPTSFILQQQQLHQPSFLPDNSNIRYNDVDSVRNQLLMQQQQQQQALSFGGVSSQFQQNQYNALQQQQQLTSLPSQQQQLTTLPNLHGSMPGINNSNNNLGMGQQLLHNFPNSNNTFTPQQQVAMQMQLMNRSTSIPTTLPNASAAQQTQLQMNSVSENSSMSNINLSSTGGANTTQQQPAVEQPNPLYQPLDSSTTEQLDTLDWWK